MQHKGTKDICESFDFQISFFASNEPQLLAAVRAEIIENVATVELNKFPPAYFCVMPDVVEAKLHLESYINRFITPKYPQFMRKSTDRLSRFLLG
jgi:hypothetical protein